MPTIHRKGLYACPWRDTRASQSCDIPVTTLPSATVRMNQTTRRFGFTVAAPEALIIRDGLKLEIMYSTSFLTSTLVCTFGSLRLEPTVRMILLLPQASHLDTSI